MIYPPNKVPAEYGKEFITNPTRVRRVLEDLTFQNNLADFIFAPGDANNGGVVYDRVTPESAANQRTRGAEERAPGTEFTQIDVGDVEPLYDVAKEYGAEIEIPLRTIKRSENRAIQRYVRHLADAVIRKIDGITMAKLEADQDIHEYGLDTEWASATSDPISDLILARGQAEDNPTDNPALAYNINTVVINPADLRRYLWARKEIREELTKATEVTSPIVDPYFEGYLGLNWVPSNRVRAGQLWLIDRDKAGALGDEDNGIQTDEWDDKKRRVKVYQAWRSVVPYITDPGAIVKVTGFAGA
ncbi:phage major capsid protein [Nesterenkonia flava]|uniref:Major capsid protein n=1 Tax=Nesterenkonia flava TaxID=469799 RepID=A0ABU1FS10_9MICC|nr:hypothetical protein [Nesterenkonia flava]MDR5711409.1 hypothetical protein [Nesterenkonia flava]